MGVLLETGDAVRDRKAVPIKVGSGGFETCKRQ